MTVERAGTQQDQSPQVSREGGIQPLSWAGNVLSHHVRGHAMSAVLGASVQPQEVESVIVFS